MSEFYNEAIKNRYLDEIENEGSRNTIKYVFLASKGVEEILGRDLYNFSKEEVAEVLRDMHMLSFHTVRANNGYIGSYISWCIKHGYRENNLNPLDTVDKKWLSQFVDRNIKIHYSYEEFLDLLEEPEMYNSQDKTFLLIMWHGIIGERFSQIKELKYSDVDTNNKTIYVKERDYHVPVDDKTIEYIEKTRFENTYYQYNSNTKEFTEKELLPSDYIFKNIKSPRGSANEPIKQNVIYNRIHTIKEVFSLEYLSPQSCKQSGMLHMAYELYNRDKVLGYDQFAEIGEKYDYSKIVNNGYEYFNTHLMRHFINNENLFNLYGQQIEIKLR